MKNILVVLPLAMIVTACAQESGSNGSAGFTSREAEWEAAMNSGDVDAIVSLYADNARLMPPNAAASVGHQGVRDSFSGMIEAGLTVDLTVIDTQSDGNIAYVVGSYELLAGDTMADAGKYIETWRRDADGAWLMTNDIWNSDAPAASGGDGNPHLMVFHEVADGDRWLAAWSGENSRRDQFMANGAAHVHTFRNADNPNLTGLVISVADQDALNAFLSSAEGAAAAEADGVDLDATTFLMEAK